MANPEHLDTLAKGVTVWNEWRQSEPLSIPDLKASNLSNAVLNGANFSFAELDDIDFRHAELFLANLQDARLRRANLSNSNLSFASLFRANLNQANLSNATLQGADLSEALLVDTDLSRADLSHAGLNHAYLRGANLQRSNLKDARLCNAYVEGANLTQCELIGTNLSGAHLAEARLCQAILNDVNLTGASLVQTDFTEATLTDAVIYGISAWGLILDGIKCSNLRITPATEPEVTVDDLDVAQFVYLMLDNQKIRNVLSTIGDRGVLILGRFTPERKMVLDAIRQRLRELHYVPMIFDFERADDRSFTETIKILAGMSKFIIADVTNPSSAPLELQAIVPDYMVPLVPIIEQGAKPFSMLADLQQRDWVLKLKTYRDVTHLIAAIEAGIIKPALDKHAELRLRKAKEIQAEELPG